MFYFIISLQAGLCLALIGIILLQQGKGADMGAAFGGGSNTLFGSAGAGNFITRLTTGICVAFMVTSILLIKAYQNAGQLTLTGTDPLAGSVMQGMEAAKPEAAPAADAKPVAAAPQLPPAAENAAPAPVAPAAANPPAQESEKK